MFQGLDTFSSLQSSLFWIIHDWLMESWDFYNNNYILHIIYVLFVNLFDKESWRWTMNWYNFPYIWNEIKLVWLHRMAVFKCVYFSMLMFFLDYFDSFFVDHNSRQTTWVDPRLNPQVCTTERILSFCVLKIITALFMLWGEGGYIVQ